MAIGIRKLDRRTAAEVAHVELTARQSEAVALVAAMRYVAREIEALAWSPEGDPRTVNAAGRLRGIADQVERRWEAVA